MDAFSDLPGVSVSSEHCEHTSTLQYINAQLVSHGFTHPPGLALDGLAEKDSKKVVKCLFGMLSQRLEDLRRTEDLVGKLRSLGYEHERLQSMHRSEVESRENAEREMHQFKSKLAASQKLLTAEAAAHKQTLSELQRSRTSLQYLRSTTQNELKRKEREVERVMERWNKVADTQAKLLVTQSGLKCANYASAAPEFSKGPGLVELAIEQAEEARGELVKENDAFRTVLLGAAKSLQGIVHMARELSSGTHVQESTPLTHPALFSPPTSILSHPENAHAKLRELYNTLRDVLGSIPAKETATAGANPETESEIKRLNEIITSLRAEIENARQSSSSAIAEQSQAIFDKFTSHVSDRLSSIRRDAPGGTGERSLELIGIPEQDDMRLKLEVQEENLRKEREKFTEVAVKLGKEKAALEAERAKLVEEKRRWAVEQMLAELPPTPGPDPDIVSPPNFTKTKVQRVSPSPPRIRPRKAKAHRGLPASPSKKTTMSKRVDSADDKPELRGGGKTRTTSKERGESGKYNKREGPRDREPETRVQPPKNGIGSGDSTTPQDTPPITVSATAATEMKKTLPLVLPTTFTLPPPSPHTSITPLVLESIPSPSNLPVAASNFDSIPLAAVSAAPVVPRSRGFSSSRTPRSTVNPSIKHAYSPARPSPLSRILMLADSPPSPPGVSAIKEGHEGAEGSGASPTELKALPRIRFAEALLKHPIDEPSPLRERNSGEFNGNAPIMSKLQGDEGETRFTAHEKGKWPSVPGMERSTTVSQKENVMNRQRASDARTATLKTKASKSSEPEKKKIVGAAQAGAKPPAARSAVVVAGMPQAGKTASGPWKPGNARRVVNGGP